MKRVITALLLLSVALSCTRRPNYTVIVSLDAFRWDYPMLYDTPWLDSIARAGVKAVMMPSYPSSTFPNHYTLATGLVPDHHGIVNSQFRDSELGVTYSMGDSLTRNNPSYYGGEPVWITAERQGVPTATLYWVGSDIPILGRYPSSYRAWADEPRLDYAGRADEAVRLMSLPEEERPRLVMVYFDDPDATGHEFGPKSIETGIMVHYLDSLVGRMYQGLRALPHGDRINLIVTSDHGMTDISDERFVNIGEVLRPEWCEYVVSSSPTSIFTAPGCRDSVLAALNAVPHVKAWPRENVPAELDYGTSPHLGDVIAAPDLGWQLSYKTRHLLGAHGYDPREPDMQVIFRASGPDFKQGYELPGLFKNTAVYPLLCKLLGVRPAPCDGDLSSAGKLLR